MASVTSKQTSPLKKHLAILFFATLGWFFIYSNLALVSHWLTFSIFNLPVGKLSSTVEFFIFEGPKVLLLLVAVVFAMGVIRTFFSPERTRTILAGNRESIGNVLAGLLGIVTPFCSCSAVPLFIGFVTAGVPLGVTFSFLISAPMVNEVALVMLYGLFGWKIALIYLSTGLLIAMISGWVIGRLKLERFVEEWVYRNKPILQDSHSDESDWNQRLLYGVHEIKEIVGKVWLYVLLGIGVGAGIHGYVPEEFMASFMGKEAWWSVPLAVVVGVPIYSNAAGVIPIVQALLEKGAALGTVLAFMMSVVALSLPETIILRKVLKPQLIAVFIGVVTFGIILVGYLFNFLF